MRPLMTTTEAAELLGVDKKTLRKQARKHGIHRVILGRVVRWRPEDVERMVERASMPAGARW
jgi:excisionase family DNA binding protein